MRNFYGVGLSKSRVAKWATSTLALQDIFSQIFSSLHRSWGCLLNFGKFKYLGLSPFPRLFLSLRLSRDLEMEPRLDNELAWAPSASIPLLKILLEKLPSLKKARKGRWFFVGLTFDFNKTTYLYVAVQMFPHACWRQVLKCLILWANFHIGTFYVL